MANGSITTAAVETVGAYPANDRASVDGTTVISPVDILGANVVSINANLLGVTNLGNTTVGANVVNDNDSVVGVTVRGVDTVGANVDNVNASVVGVADFGLTTVGANVTRVNAAVVGVTVSP